ncbi:MAG: XylR family transcriptional regulator [Phycisphaerae bacterium]
MPPNTIRQGLLEGVGRFLRLQGSPWQLLVKPWSYNEAIAFTDWTHCDGVLVSTFPEPVLSAARDKRIPLVAVSASQNMPHLPRVLIDSCQVGRLAAESLLELGFRRFLYVGMRDTWFSAQRQAGFEEVLEENGRRCQICLIAARHGPEAWRASLQLLSKELAGLETPLGAFACTDEMAERLLEICMDLQLRVPDDVAIIGVDNTQEICNFSSPTISSIDPDLPQVGFLAGRLLDSLAEGRRPPQSPVLVCPKGLVARGSSDILAIEDPLIVDALRYIRLHADKPLRVADVVEALPTSRRPLEVRFRQAVGRSIAEEIMACHLNQARNYLLNSDMRLLDVALASGFRSQQHFSEAFKRRFGQSPGDFRRTRRGLLFQ